MGGDEAVPQWLPGGNQLDPAWLASKGGHAWLDKGVGRAWLISERGREWVETPDGMEWFCSREGEWWSRNRPSWATREEVLRREKLPQTLEASAEKAVQARLRSLTGWSSPVAVGWLPEQRFLVCRDEIRVYGRVGLIVLDDENHDSVEESAKQLIEAIRADDWFADTPVLPREWPNLIETLHRVAQFRLDTTNTPKERT